MFVWCPGALSLSISLHWKFNSIGAMHLKDGRACMSPRLLIPDNSYVGLFGIICVALNVTKCGKSSLNLIKIM